MIHAIIHFICFYFGFVERTSFHNLFGGNLGYTKISPRIFPNALDLSRAASGGVMFKKREPIFVFVTQKLNILCLNCFP